MKEICGRSKLNLFFEFLHQIFPHWFINYCFHLPLAIMAVIFYGYPAKKLTVIGVTGTDGKTTTSTLIYEILRKAGKKVALISTVSAKIGNKDLPTGLHVTTPDPWELQRLLRLIVHKDYQYVVLESTSHGLDQFRLFGCNFYLGVITNATHEHLDYHKTFSKYLAAKARLFKRTKYSIFNKDDVSYQKLVNKTKGQIITYGMNEADYTPQKFPFKTKLYGEYNQYNCLAGISVAKTLGISSKIIKETIACFKGVVGRMEEIKTGKGFRVFIDFAHTPNGLQNALLTLKQFKPARLIAVFGCAGLRDRTKRPIMGKISCELADKIILTAEDPRTEDVNKIINEIAKGCQNKQKISYVPDRRKAIDLAINKIAKTNDLVGFFGKGHEQSLCFGTKEYPWSEHQEVKNALKRRKNV